MSLILTASWQPAVSPWRTFASQATSLGERPSLSLALEFYARDSTRRRTSSPTTPTASIAVTA